MGETLQTINRKNLRAADEPAIGLEHHRHAAMFDSGDGWRIDLGNIEIDFFVAGRPGRSAERVASAMEIASVADAPNFWTLRRWRIALGRAGHPVLRCQIMSTHVAQSKAMAADALLIPDHFANNQ